MSSRLEVIAGPMFSGKSEELIRRIERAQWAGKRVKIIKPAIDDRVEGEIASRVLQEGVSMIHKRFPAIAIKSSNELLELRYEEIDLLAADEAQFFDSEFAYTLSDVLQKNGENLRVVASGLDLDYALRPFGTMPQLLAMADKVTKLDAVCMKCGADEARFTQRLQGSTAQNQVGNIGDYQVRCRPCHFIFAG
jgi:thymidine kinase